jgi:hypothetical protein
MNPQRLIACMFIVIAQSGTIACRNVGSVSSAGTDVPDASAVSGMSTVIQAQHTVLMPEQNAQPMPACTADSLPRAGGCQGGLAGVYAIEVDVDAWWADEADPTTPLLDPGRGKISVLYKSELKEPCADGSAANAVLHACDVRFPPLYADSLGGVVQLMLPEAMWSSHGMPGFAGGVHATGFEPTDEVVLDPVIASFGIELATRGAAWPSFKDTPFLACANGKQGQDCFPDHDSDGHPGISVDVLVESAPPVAPYPRRGGWRYVPAPIDASPAFVGRGATTLYLGLRSELSAGYSISSDCGGGVGTAQSSGVEMRVLDCAMMDGKPCNAAGATFVDQNVPVFHALAAGETPPPTWRHQRRDADLLLDRSPSAGPQSRWLRLGDLADDLPCTSIREAFPAR